MRTLSARTFETLLDESNVRENEVRSRPANEPRYARPPVSSFETNALNLGTPKRAWRRAVDARRPTQVPHVAHSFSERFFGVFLEFFWRKKKAHHSRARAGRGDASTLFLAPRSRIALERARADPRPTSAFSLHKKGVDGASESAVASARRDGARRG